MPNRMSCHALIASGLAGGQSAAPTPLISNIAAAAASTMFFFIIFVCFFVFIGLFFSLFSHFPGGKMSNWLTVAPMLRRTCCALTGAKRLA